MKKWLTAASDALVLLLLALSAFAGAILYSAGNRAKVPSLCGYAAPYAEDGGAEALGIAEGSLMLVKRAAPDRLERGDIAVFLSPQNPAEVLAREIAGLRRDEAGLLLLDTSDGLAVPERFVLGRYERSGGALAGLLSFAASRLGLILLVVVPAGLIVLLSLWGGSAQADAILAARRAARGKLELGKALARGAGDALTAKQRTAILDAAPEEKREEVLRLLYPNREKKSGKGARAAGFKSAGRGTTKNRGMGA